MRRLSQTMVVLTCPLVSLCFAVFTEADEREIARRSGKGEAAPAASAKGEAAAAEQPVVLAPAAVASLPPPARPSKPAVYL